MRTSVQRGGLGLTGILLVVAALVALSARAGGPVSWYVTNGISMLPTISKGTLVVVSRKPTYEVGDVVAYRSRDLARTVVLHRVTGFNGDRMVLKGDNNDFLDPEQPLPSEALGSRVFQVPRVGPVLDWLRKPWVLALGAVVLAEALLRAPARRRRRPTGDGGGTGRSATAATEPPADAGAPRAVGQVRERLGSLSFTQVPPGAETGLKAAIAGGLLLATVASFGPFLKETAPAEDDKAQRVVTWSYGAEATPGIAYPGGVVETDDVLYPKLLDAADVTAELALDLPDDAVVNGTWHLEVGVGNDKGWTRTTSKGSPAPLDVLPQRLTTRVPVDELLTLQQQLDAETGVPSGQLQIQVKAVLDLTVADGGQVDQVAGTSVLSFIGTPTEVGRDPESPLRQVQPLALGDAGDSTRLELVGMSLPPGATRTGALAIVVISGLALFGLSAGRRFEDEDAAISRMAAERLVPADTSCDPEQIVDVSSFEALRGIAERYERVILYADVQGLRFYFVLDDGIAYRYYSEKRAARLDAQRAALAPAEAHIVEQDALPPIPRPRAAADDGVLR